MYPPRVNNQKIGKEVEETTRSPSTNKKYFHLLPATSQTCILSVFSPLSRWCHPTISSSAIPFSSCSQSSPASGSLPVSQLFPSSGQRIGVSASAWVLPMNIQGWSPLGLTGWLSLLSKGLSRVFSSPTIRTHQFSGVNPTKNICNGCGVNCESTPPRDEISQGPLGAAS